MFKMSTLFFGGSILFQALGRRMTAQAAQSHAKLKIAVMASSSDDDCLTMLKHLPPGADIIARGADLDALRQSNSDFAGCECLLVVSGTGNKLEEVMKEMKSLRWIHGIFAGLDHMRSPEFDGCSDKRAIVVTNAKGVFSSSLAEWILGACWYFSKDINRLNANKSTKLYERYSVGELRGKVMGIIGYGDIGRAAASLANCYGMRVIAHRRRPELSKNDPLVSEIYGNDGIKTVMEKSDFLVIAAALTQDTEGMIGKDELSVAKQGQVLINVGRGRLIDEESLIDILVAKKPISAAALDVFCVEPLPASSPLWELPNVLLSPHNADMTIGFRHDSVKFFTENCKLYLDKGLSSLQNVVDPKAGY